MVVAGGVGEVAAAAVGVAVVAGVGAAVGIDAADARVEDISFDEIELKEMGLVENVESVRKYVGE